MIVIVNYGMGNLGSILNMLKKIGATAIISSNIDEIEKAEKLILPGVGSFDNGMSNLEKYGLIEVLNRKVLEEKTPVLGICLGMQLLTQSSNEGILPGLGWIDAKTVKFEFNKLMNLKIPHMGWNTIAVEKESPLFYRMYETARFYFVHSYYVKCNDNQDLLTSTCYGHKFASSIMKGNIFGTQFHPEKSHKFGLKLLKNYVELI